MIKNYYLLKEALRFVNHSIKQIFQNHKKYQGNHIEICQKIVDDCWNGNFFRTGAGNFNQFWTRDFGFCCESLINLGYKDKVKKTLEYALTKFKKHNNITTQITPEGIPIDFPNYTPESVAYIVRCLRLLGDKNLINNYKELIAKEVKKAYKIAFDKNNNIIKKKYSFSSIKDHYKRSSSMYNNSMILMLSNDLDCLNLKNPLKKHALKKTQKKIFWTGEFFLDDLSGGKYVSGDANVFPFWTGNFTDKRMFLSCLKHIQNNQLDTPWPLKYTKIRHKKNELFLPELFAPNYEGNTIWMHLGLCFIKTVNKFDRNKAKKYINSYKKLIEKNKNFLELYNPDGTVYKKLFYTADEGMLWASIYLDLVKNG